MVSPCKSTSCTSEQMPTLCIALSPNAKELYTSWLLGSWLRSHPSKQSISAWSRLEKKWHDDVISTLLALCEGKRRQMASIAEVDVFLRSYLDMLLNKGSICRWFETAWLMWRECNGGGTPFIMRDLGLGSTNERKRCYETASLIGRAYTLNDACYVVQYRRLDILPRFKIRSSGCWLNEANYAGWWWTECYIISSCWKIVIYELYANVYNDTVSSIECQMDFT